MIDLTVALALGLVVGVGGGFLNSWMKFNSSGEPFDGRKHGNALITGAIAGLALAIANSQALLELDSVQALMISLGTIFIGATGIDMARSRLGSMIAQKSKEKVKEDLETEKQQQ